jgi:hypothetical protein
MTITLTRERNAEQTASRPPRADEVQPDPLTVESYLLRSLNAEIASYTDADFNAAALRLVSAAKDLPFEQRMAIIAQVEQAIQAP